MNQISKDTKCYSCYGCGQLERENFTGVKSCSDYIQYITREEEQNQGYILQVKNILKGEQEKI